MERLPRVAVMTFQIFLQLPDNGRLFFVALQSRLTPDNIISEASKVLLLFPSYYSAE